MDRILAGSLGGICSCTSPKREPFEERIAAEAIGSVETRATGLPHRVEAGEAGMTQHVHFDAADHVVGRRVDGDEILRAVDVELVEQLGELRKALAELSG